MFCRTNKLLLCSLALIVLTFRLMAQPQFGGAVIQGIVRYNQAPLPGAIVTAVDKATAKATRAITEVNGQYILKVGETGEYHVTVDMTWFASDGTDIEVTDAAKPVQKDFGLSLLSEAQRVTARQTPAIVNRPARSAPSTTGADAPAEDPADAPETDLFADLQSNPSLVVLPGMTPDAPTESVAVRGNTATPQFGGAFDPRQLDLSNIPGSLEQQTFGAPASAAVANNVAGNPGARGNDFGATFGNIRGGGAGGGGRGGRGGNFGSGRPARRNANPININFSYTLNDSALNAAPYHLTGQVAPVKPNYCETISVPPLAAR